MDCSAPLAIDAITDSSADEQTPSKQMKKRPACATRTSQAKTTIAKKPSRRDRSQPSDDNSMGEPDEVDSTDDIEQWSDEANEGLSEDEDELKPAAKKAPAMKRKKQRTPGAKTEYFTMLYKSRCAVGIMVKDPTVEVGRKQIMSVQVKGSTLQEVEDLANIVVEELNKGSSVDDTRNLLNHMKAELADKVKKRTGAAMS